jgi:hypothetical protein
METTGENKNIYTDDEFIYINIKNPNFGKENDLMHFYSLGYWDIIGIHPEIHVNYNYNNNSSGENNIQQFNQQTGGYFQDINKLTIPYKYFVYFMENNPVSLVANNTSGVLNKFRKNIFQNKNAKNAKNAKKEGAFNLFKNINILPFQKKQPIQEPEVSLKNTTNDILQKINTSIQKYSKKTNEIKQNVAENIQSYNNPLDVNNNDIKYINNNNANTNLFELNNIIKNKLEPNLKKVDDDIKEKTDESLTLHDEPTNKKNITETTNEPVEKKIDDTEEKNDENEEKIDDNEEKIDDNEEKNDENDDNDENDENKEKIDEPIILLKFPKTEIVPLYNTMKTRNYEENIDITKNKFKYDEINEIFKIQQYTKTEVIYLEEIYVINGKLVLLKGITENPQQKIQITDEIHFFKNTMMYKEYYFHNNII